MKAPIFILGCHKSGSTLLRNLFDGVPGLFVAPIEMHFFQYAGYWVDYALRHAKPQKRTFEETVQNIVEGIRPSGTRLKEGGGVLPDDWDERAFTAYLKDFAREVFTQGDMQGFIDCYVEALHISLCGQPMPGAVRLVEKSVEQAEFAVVLKMLFPDAKFVHIVRNPYANFVSIRRYLTRSGNYPQLWKVQRALQNSYYHLYNNTLLIEGYLAVRYEDLLNDARGTMEKLASGVGIPFTEELLIPTTMGRAWSGNSVTGQKFQGISTVPLTAWESDIYPIEIGLVNRYFKHVLEDYGYQYKHIPASVYRRCSSERLMTYLNNRLLWRICRH